jgi:hypothetical protein
MNLRIAKKIMKNVKAGKCKYTELQIRTAHKKVQLDEFLYKWQIRTAEQKVKLNEFLYKCL